ncbi:hypothetical protein AB4238_22345 [Shewanella sp. 10N.286.45.A1]|uniref:hypothetical protein n=1 Tax=Shewanella sp. 10N.286.45.A1 TaxID=3229694 RepID=UPI00354DDD28
MKKISRRSFLISGSALVIATAVGGMTSAQASNGFIPGGNDIPKAPVINDFNLKLQLIADQNHDFMRVAWEIATDSDFEHIINQDKVSLEQTKQQALNITLHEIPLDTEIFYRLTCEHCDAYEIDELPFNQGVNINNVGLVYSSLSD